MKKLLAYVALMNLLGNSAYATPLYQCVDEEGNIQYTQIPIAGCSEIKVTTIQSITTPVEATKSQEESTTATTDSSQPQDSSNTEAETKPSAQQTVEEGCKIATEKMRKLESNLALAKPDKDNPGKFVPLTEDMRQQERAQAKEYFDMFCQGGEAEGSE